MQFEELDNGAKLLLVERPGGLVYCEFQVLAGSYLPAAPETAHLLEHLAGHFTTQREPDAHELNARIESWGVETNAHLDGYAARYHMLGQAKDAPRMARLLLALFRDFAIDPRIYKQERRALIAELEALSSEPWIELIKRTQRELFPRHPIGLPLAQRIASGERLAPSELLRFWRRYYQPRGALFIAVGDLPLAELRQLYAPLARMRNDSRAVVALEWPRVSGALALDGPRVLFVKEDTDTARLQLTYRLLIDQADPRRFAVDLIAKLLGRGVSSRLLQRLRTRLGLVYALSCAVQLDRDAALSTLEIVTYVDAAQLRRAVAELTAALRGLEPTRREWRRVKNLAITELLLAAQGAPPSLAALLSEGVLCGGAPQTPEWRRRQYEAVTRKDLIALAEQLFAKERLLISYSAAKPVL